MNHSDIIPSVIWAVVSASAIVLTCYLMIKFRRWLFSRLKDCRGWVWAMVRTNLMKTIRILLLVLLLPYVWWILEQDRFSPGNLIPAFIIIAVLIPVILARVVAGRARSTAAALLGTPIVLCVVLYLLSLGDRESLAWYPLVAAWILAITAPVWVIVSAVFGAMRDKKGKVAL